MLGVRFIVGLSLLATVLGQEFAQQCPEPNGFFADAVQCDKYYSCVDNVLTEKLCPDGFVFNDLNPEIEKCDFPFHISCEGRPELQVAQPTPNCPNQHGYFPHADRCDAFFFCADGTAAQLTCPETLVFSLKTGNCAWPDAAGRVGCAKTKVNNFTCPTVDFLEAVAHPRYPDPSDCQYFYVCINGETPRRNGCKFGEVFNGETVHCDQPLNVPGCQDYYKEFFDNYFSTTGGEGGAITLPDVLAAAIGSGFEIPDNQRRVRINANAAGQLSHSAINPPRRRRPTSNSAVRANVVSEVKSEAPAQPAPAPKRRERPSLNRPQGQSVHETPERGVAPVRRRRPLRTKTVLTTPKPTTTTATPAPILAAEEDYYYYDEYPEETVAAAAP